MATNAVVATGTIGPSVGNTCSLTVSGFGTPTAALLFISNANTTNNPQDGLNFSVGMWSASEKHSSSITSVHNGSVSITYRRQFNDYPLIQLNSDGTTLQAFNVSTTTDGLTLTVASSGSSASRYVYAILINGTSNVSAGSINLGTGTSAIDITAPGFRPDLVFFHGTGAGNETAAANAILSFGVAHNNGSTTNQGMVGVWSEDQQDTTDTGSYINSGYVAGQVFNGSAAWLASVSDFDSSGFSITPSANASSDIVYYLAIELADADDAYVGIIDSKTSTGTQAYTGTGFTPDVVGLVQTMCTATNTHTTQGSLAFGATDGTRSRVLSIVDEDAQAVVDTDSASYDGALWIRADSGSDDAKATISSLDSDGFTLNYSDGSASARKILAFAIGNSVVASITGTFAATESGTDTLAIAGDILVEGALSASESGADTLAIAGDVLVNGALSASESGVDALTIAGDVLVEGALAATESGSDTCDIAGEGTALETTGALSASESGSDTAALAGKVHVAGTLSATEGALDAFAVSGDILVQGALSATESGADTAEFTAPASDSAKLDLILDILQNKQVLDPATGLYTLYADDGVTVLYTAAAWEDAAGTIPYSGGCLRRIDAMT